jgi:hypothetical protein
LSSGGGLVNDQLVRSYQAEVARRAAAVRQNLSFLSPSDQDAPILTAGGSPSIVPPSDGDTAPSVPPDPEGGLFADTAVVPPPDAGVWPASAEHRPAASVSPPETLTPIVADFGLGSELLAPAQPDFEPKKRKKVAPAPAKPRTQHAARSQTKQGVITNRAGMIQHSKILIIALQEALDYDPVRGHNQRPPVLWNDDPAYLRDVGSLVLELRRLNTLLEAKRPRKAETGQAVVDLSRHLNKFLDSYASWFGKGAAVLTVGVIAGLLQHAGLDPTAVCAAINKLPH